jgi:hypothetical protein
MGSRIVGGDGVVVVKCILLVVVGNLDLSG